MKKPGTIRIHREEAGGDRTFSVEGPRAVLLPFFEQGGEVRLSEIARAVGEKYDVEELMVGCTAIDSIGNRRLSDQVRLTGYISELPRSARWRGANPPTREQPCPGCNGKGTIVTFDVEAMREARIERGLTQVALAKAAGWQATVVCELESGARPMTAASAERYWKALQVAERGPA